MTGEPRDDRRLAVDLFNETWSLLDADGRTHAQDERMIHAAHASRFHWEQAGGAEQLVVGDWQIARSTACCNELNPRSTMPAKP